MTIGEVVILVVQILVVVALCLHHRHSQRGIDKLAPLAPVPPTPKPIYAGLSLHCGHTHADPQVGPDGLTRCPVCHVEHLCQR